MHDLLLENRITFAELARREGVNVSTVWRWTLRGVRGCQLECFHIGGRKFTTAEAFARWVEATNASPGTIGRPRTNRQREAAIARAEKECAEMGI